VAVVVGVLVFLLLRLAHWRQQLFRQSGWQQYRHVVQQQEGLVQQLARQVACPLWAWVLGWCAVAPWLVVCGVLATTVGQLWVLWRQPQAQRFWLKVCLTFELGFWVCITCAAVRMVQGLDPPPGSRPALAVAIAVGAAMRGTLKLLFDVEDKIGITLWGWDCWQQAFLESLAVVLALFGFLMQGILGGTWLLAVCRLSLTPWQLAARLQQLSTRV
jgi:hypothetical protein